MAERKAKRKRAKGTNEGELTEEDKALKKQMEMVAKYLRRSVKCKTAVIKGQNIEFFTGSKVVDVLMESKWGGASRRSMLGTNEPAFPSRVSAISYCERLLECGYFVRGYRLEVESKDKDKEKEKDVEISVKDREASPRATARRKKAKSAASSKESNGEKKQNDGKKKDGDELQKKKKKKFKIRFHEEQLFEDSASEIFIWQYSPHGWFGTLVGLGLVLVTVAVTMYPLWPEWTRYGAYIVSVTLACLLGLLLLGELVRIVLFAVIWLVTWGHVHFTILPNLYEDVGFWESFRPVYKLNYSKSSEEEDDEDDEDVEKVDGAPDSRAICSDEETKSETVEELGNEDGTSAKQMAVDCSDKEATANRVEGSDSDYRQQSASDA